jgi:hypothetical protein
VRGWLNIGLTVLVLACVVVIVVTAIGRWISPGGRDKRAREEPASAQAGVGA